MKILSTLVILALSVSCAQTDLQRENEELLALTKTLSLQVEELTAISEDAAAKAMIAEAEAIALKELALEQAASATARMAELESKLTNCK